MKQIERRLTPQEFRQRRKELIEEDFDTHRHPVDCYCKRCGALAEAGILHVSIHAEEWTVACVGGEFDKVSIPYCPVCEPNGHTMSTCMHVTTFPDNYVSFLGKEQRQRLPSLN